MSTPRTRQRAGRLARSWPLLAVLTLVAHGLVHGYLQSRPGQAAMAVFTIAPKLLFALTVLATGMAARDVLHGGWRRLLRGTVMFPLGAILGSGLLALLTYRAYPSSYDTRPVPWCLALPLEGDVDVLQGGPTTDVNNHAGTPSQRYAYDLGIRRGPTTRQGDASGTSGADGYDQAVLAPIDGVVVAAVEAASGPSSMVPAWWPWRHPDGSYVVLQVDDLAYLVLAQLQAGSIRVRPGDHVLAGVSIARVGDSRRSIEPQLHLQVQDAPVPGRGEGIPVDFCAYDVVAWGATWDTAQRIERGMPTGGDRRQVIRPAR